MSEWTLLIPAIGIPLLIALLTIFGDKGNSQ